MNTIDWTKSNRRIIIDSDIHTVYNAWIKSEKLENGF